MEAGVKAFVLEGEGSPLKAQESLLAAILLDIGFPFLTDHQGVKKSFQDVVDPGPPAKREFYYWFDGSHQLLIDGSDSVRETHKKLLEAIRDMRITEPGIGDWPARLIKIQRNGRTYRLPYDSTPQEKELLIQRYT